MPLNEYIKTWINGEIITAEKMNAISNALGNVITEMNNAKCTNIKDGEGNCSIVQNAITDINANIASGTYSHAEGTETTAFGAMSHAEGSNTKAMGAISHAEGYYTVASGNQSHAEGRYNEASNQGSHAEGEQTISSGQSSHSEGKFTKAQGTASHAEGIGTIASYQAQHVFGSYNDIINNSNITNADRGTYIEIVGNGTDADNRSNARTLDWEGNQSITGNLTIEKGTSNEITITSTQFLCQRCHVVVGTDHDKQLAPLPVLSTEGITFGDSSINLNYPAYFFINDFGQVIGQLPINTGLISFSKDIINPPMIVPRSGYIPFVYHFYWDSQNKTVVYKDLPLNKPQANLHLFGTWTFQTNTGRLFDSDYVIANT